jgi:Tfp pilus assembly protein PilN
MALREINLIPTEILDRRHLLRHLYFWSGCLTISLTLIFGLYLYHTRAILSKKHTPAKLGDIHKNLSVRIEEIKRLQIKIDRLRRQHTVLEAITINQPYSRIFEKLADLMNEYTWLTQLSIESGKNGGKENDRDASLKLSGFSFSNEELGNFLNQLSNEPMFKAVVLNHAQEIKTERSKQYPRGLKKAIKFMIECSIPRV